MASNMVVTVPSWGFTSSGSGTVGEAPEYPGLTGTYAASGYIEWRVTLPQAGSYRLHARITSLECRPCELTINGARQAGTILGETTGGWYADTLEWFAYGPYDFKQGENAVRIDFSQGQPHLSELGFSPVEPLALKGPWRQVPDSGAVIAVARLRDGRILGVGTANDLSTRGALTGGWTPVPNSGGVVAAIQLQDGTILGVGTDRALWTRATFTSGWVQIPASTAVIAVTQLLDGRLLGVGADNFLWVREALTSPWEQVPNSGSVKAVLQLQDGMIVGIGMDDMLWTRATLTSPWVQVPDSGPVIGVAELADGTLLGVGVDHHLHVAERVPGPAKPASTVPPAGPGLDPAVEEVLADQARRIAALEKQLAEVLAQPGPPAGAPEQQIGVLGEAPHPSRPALPGVTPGLALEATIPAKDFAAAGPGTIAAAPDYPDLAVTYAAGYIEWKVDLPRAGKWHLHARLTAAEACPCTVSINGIAQPGTILGEVTGGWRSDTLQWFVYGPYPFHEGENVIRIDFADSHPHLAELGFTWSEDQAAVAAKPADAPAPRRRSRMLRWR